MSLLACPFCRELFSPGEASECPLCGVALKRLEDLPLSREAVEVEEAEGLPTGPELEKLPWNDFRRMRGPLSALPLVGLGLFFLPWIDETLPIEQTLSGFDLARHGSGWIYAAFAAWSVLLPTVFSRRTITQLRGARVAAAFLAAIPGVTGVDLLIFRPHPTVGRIDFSYLASLYATIALSVVCVYLATRLGRLGNEASRGGRGPRRSMGTASGSRRGRSPEPSNGELLH